MDELCIHAVRNAHKTLVGKISKFERSVRIQICYLPESVFMTLSYPSYLSV